MVREGGTQAGVAERSYARVAETGVVERVGEGCYCCFGSAGGDSHYVVLHIEAARVGSWWRGGDDLGVRFWRGDGGPGS